jgi:hypothetical protein
MTTTHTTHLTEQQIAHPRGAADLIRDANEELCGQDRIAPPRIDVPDHPQIEPIPDTASVADAHTQIRRMIRQFQRRWGHMENGYNAMSIPQVATAWKRLHRAERTLRAGLPESWLEMLAQDDR